jgi:translation elongation factor EF-Ts
VDDARSLLTLRGVWVSLCACSYVHGAIGGKAAGSQAALVALRATPGSAAGAEGALLALGEKVAMHVVASRPLYVSKEDVAPVCVHSHPPPCVPACPRRLL